MSVNITYRFADAAVKAWAAQEWSQVVADHMHLEDGFTVVACAGTTPIGLISITYRSLPAPLEDVYEAYLDIIEVRPEFRRQGIARNLLQLALHTAAKTEARQIRGWSSEDKVEAIRMWQALDFTLCPTTIYPRERAVNGYYFVRLLP